VRLPSSHLILSCALLNSHLACGLIFPFPSSSKAASVPISFATVASRERSLLFIYLQSKLKYPASFTATSFSLSPFSLFFSDGRRTAEKVVDSFSVWGKGSFTKLYAMTFYVNRGAKVIINTNSSPIIEITS